MWNIENSNKFLLSSLEKNCYSLKIRGKKKQTLKLTRDLRHPGKERSGAEGEDENGEKTVVMDIGRVGGGRNTMITHEGTNHILSKN